MRRTPASWWESGAWFSIDSAAGGRRRIASNTRRSCRVLPRGGDLDAVADDPWIGGELVYPSRGVSRDLLWIEVTESAAVAVALVEDDRPIESRLRGLQNQELEMRAIVVRRHAPFPIVILEHHRLIDVDPGTPPRLRIRHVYRLHDLKEDCTQGVAARTRRQANLEAGTTKTSDSLK